MCCDVLADRVPRIGVGRFEAVDVLEGDTKRVRRGGDGRKVAPSWAGGGGSRLLREVVLDKCVVVLFLKVALSKW